MLRIKKPKPCHIFCGRGLCGEKILVLLPLYHPVSTIVIYGSKSGNWTLDKYHRGIHSCNADDLWLVGGAIQCYDCWTKQEDTCGYPETLGEPGDCEARDNVCKKVVTRAYSVIKKGRDSYYELGKTSKKSRPISSLDSQIKFWMCLSVRKGM